MSYREDGTDPFDWSTEEVVAAVANGDEQIAKSLLFNEVDGRVLLTVCTYERLKEDIGILPLGKRERIMRTIQGLRKISRRFDEYILEIAAATSLPDGPDDLESDTCLALRPPSLDPPSFDPPSAKSPSINLPSPNFFNIPTKPPSNPLASPKGIETPRTPAIHSPAITDPLETKPPRAPAEVLIKPLGIPPLPSPIPRKRKASSTLGNTPTRQARTAETETPRDGYRTPPAEPGKLFNLISRHEEAMPLIVHDPFSEFKVQGSPATPAVRIEQSDENSLGRAVPFCIKAHPQVPPPEEIGHGDEMEVDDEHVGNKYLPSSPGERPEEADRGRWEVTHEEITTERQEEQPDEHSEEVLPTASLPERSSARRRRYLASKGLEVDEIFYGDVKVGDQIHDYDSDHDDFCITSWSQPVGLQMTVNRHMYRFLQNPERTTIVSRTGHLRVGVKPYKEKYVLKHHLQSCTVYDIQPDGTCKIFREDMSTIRLPWVTNSTKVPESSSETQIVRFMDVPERPQPILNTQDNSVHDWDYLIKWQNIGNDDVLPAFGDSGSENEDTVAAWNEYQAEYGPHEKPLGKTSRRPLSAREIEEALNEGIRQRVAVWRSKVLPRKEAQAFKIWRIAKKRKERKLMAHKSAKRIQELDDRLKKQKAEISGITWWTKDAVKKQTRSMALTIYEREESKWLINLMERRIAPEKPKEVRAAEGEISQDSEGDDEESLGSDSEADFASDDDDGMEGFIVADGERDFLNGQELEVEGEKEVEEELRLKAQVEEKLVDSDSSAEEDQPPRRSRRRTAGGESGGGNQEMELEGDRGDETERGAMADVVGDRAVEESDDEFQDITESLVDKGKGYPKSVSSSAGAIKVESVFPSSTPSKNASIPIIDLTLDDSPTERPSQRIEISTEDDMPWPGEISNKLLLKLVNGTDTTMKAGIFYRLEDYKLSKLYPLVISVAKQFNVLRIRNVEGLDLCDDPSPGSKQPISNVDSYNAKIYRTITWLYVSWVFGKEIRPTRRLSSDELKALDVLPKFKEFRMLLKQLTNIDNADTPEETEDEPVPGASGHGRNGIMGRKDPISEPKPEPPRGHRKRPRRDVVEEDLNAKASRDRAHKIHKNLLARIKQRERKGDQTEGKIAINLGRYSKYKDIFFHDYLAQNLKPHQIEGTRFLWQQLVQSGEGRGALLAHTMGLGKTLQVIALLYTLATAGASEDSKVFEQIPENLRESRTLILSPPGLVENWWDEFHKWIPQRDDDPNQLDLAATGQILKADSTVAMSERLRTINEWYTNGGVLLMGYTAFRNLVDTKIRATIFGATTQVSRGQQKTIQEMLLEGPNIIIADEAHCLKNHEAQISQAARGFRSMSRIAMTGSPLSNNLLEYWTMIDWIDPGFLGPRKEFQLKFVDPIQDGLYADSNFHEKRRCLKMLNVLKNDIGPKIHRADIGVIEKDLPPKTEFMVKVPLTPFQIEMYTRYVTDPVTTGGIEPSNGKGRGTVRFFDIIHLLSLICNHPMCFVQTLVEREEKKQAAIKKHKMSKDEIILTEDEELQELIDLDGEPAPNEELLCEANQPYPWATEIIKTVKDPRSLEHSNKMVALKIIVEHSIYIGDQVLIFSHGVYTLNYLEALLIEWKVNYLRLDGKTRIDVRQSSTKSFNAGEADVFLVSTEAGGLGLNLPGANRVIVFDFKWSPMWEEQAVGRAYRLGQKKHVFVYRFHAVGTFEELKRNKILFKSQLQSRVVDKRDPLRLATKDLRQYLLPPKEVPQEDISEYKGKDLVLDMVMDRVGFINGIQYSETFQRDPEDTLTEEELRETAQLLNEARLLRKDPGYRQKLREDALKKTQAESDPAHWQKLHETFQQLREESLRNTMSEADLASLQMARELEVQATHETRFAGNPIVPSSMRPLPITHSILSNSPPPTAIGSLTVTTNPATSMDDRLATTPITPVIPSPQSPAATNRFNLNLKALKALPKMNISGSKNKTTGQDDNGGKVNSNNDSNIAPVGTLHLEG